LENRIENHFKKSLLENALFCGDNLEILREYIPTSSVDLIYIDPPFFSNRTYNVIWGDEAEIRSFKDVWTGGISSYISWLEPRIRELRRVLKPTGSFYIHLDWHANHYVRVELLDKIFGADNFQNEIIWWYRGGGVSKNRFGRRHDTIFFYSNGKRNFFDADAVRTEYSQNSIERLKYKARAFRGEKVYENYEPHPLGKHPDDVWPIQPIMPSSKERYGYPTQKPEKLLGRIIKASSKPGEVVVDAFCGCGTTLAVAQKLNRRWLGIDISFTAIELVKQRLNNLGAMGFPIIGMPTTVEDAKKLETFDFQNWIMRKIHGYPSAKKTGDWGIDGYTLLNQYPIQVKQSEKVGRPELDKFYSAIIRSKKNKGYFIAFSFSTGAITEAQRLIREENIVLNLVTVQDILEGKIVI
jgi:DNA modification methylase